VPFQPNTFTGNPVQGGCANERVSGRTIGIATKLIERDEEDVHDEACST